jgi:hypothetical protein
MSLVSLPPWLAWGNWPVSPCWLTSPFWTLRSAWSAPSRWVVSAAWLVPSVWLVSIIWLVRLAWLGFTSWVSWWASAVRFDRLAWLVSPFKIFRFLHRALLGKCTFSWVLIKSIRLNLLGQDEHWYGLRSLWLFLCRRMFPTWLKLMPQTSQE